MEGKTGPLMRTLVCCAALVLSSSSFAQQFSVKLGGVVTELFSGDPLKGVLVRVVKAGITENEVITRRNGRYDFQLERGWKYAVWFSKKGMVSKFVMIDTRGIPPYPDVPFYDMDLQMTLFPWIKGIDLGAFDEPMGLAAYKANVRNMSWDTPYTEQRRPVLSNLMDEYQKTFTGYYKRRDRRQRAQGP